MQRTGFGIYVKKKPGTSSGLITRHLMSVLHDTFQVSAGATVSDRLAENSKATILLIEAGGDPYHRTVQPT